MNTRRLEALDVRPGTRVHCVGIGGIGVSAVAQWLAHLGARVSGSDRAPSPVTALLAGKGIAVAIEPNGGALPEDAEIVVYSDAVPASDPARRAAEEKGVRQYSYAEALGALTEPYATLAVSGTHGKTTTTALAARILEAAGMDPTVVVGARVPEYGGTNFRAGGSGVAVVEADEYAGHCLELAPAIAVITNVDYDHVDTFPTVERYREVFRRFVETVRPDGSVVVRAEDAPLISASVGNRDLRTFHVETSGGRRRPATFTASHLITGEQGTQCDIVRGSRRFARVRLALPGTHLVWDALAAVAAASRWDVPADTIAGALASFRGTGRRFEHVGDLHGVPVISDYAHHPVELQALLDAARQRYPGRRILLAYQPHHGARTRAFAGALIDAIAGADAAIVAEVYDVAGREADAALPSTRDWPTALTRRDVPAVYAETLEDVAREVREHVQPNDVLLIAGAGSIDEVARNLVGTGR